MRPLRNWIHLGYVSSRPRPAKVAGEITRKEHNMKVKLLLACIVLSMFVLVSGCGEEAPTETESDIGRAEDRDSTVNTLKRPILKLPVEVLALTVAKPNPEEPPFSVVSGVWGGVHVYCNLITKHRTIIEMDHGESRLTSLKDDRGTDLTPKADDPHTRSIGWDFIAKDGRSMSFCFQNSEAVPAKGATKIIARAELALVCGSDLKTAEQKNVPLLNGTAVNVGPLTMKIVEVEDLKDGTKEKEKDPAFGRRVRMEGAKMSFRLTTGEKSKGSYMDCIHRITFLDAEGKEVRHESHGSWSIRGVRPEKVTYMREYELARKVDTLTIRISRFDKVEKVIVPVEVSAGVGL